MIGDATNKNYERMRAFYEDVLNGLDRIYPELLQNDVKLVKVFHAFSDKIPLVEALRDRGLLAGLALKKSSVVSQPKLAQEIQDRVTGINIFMSTEDFLPTNAVQALSQRCRGSQFILGDHGGYFVQAYPHLKIHFGDSLMGVTEHTTNGLQRWRDSINGITFPPNFISSARSALKLRSDQQIANSIVKKVISQKKDIDRSTKILIIGHGVMGGFAIEALYNHPNANNLEIFVCDKNKPAQCPEGFPGLIMTQNKEDFLSDADVVILATDTVNSEPPVLDLNDILKMKRGSILTSMTSINDEIDYEFLLSTGVFKTSGVQVLYEGRPANTVFRNGGAGPAICMVEAAGLAADFVIASREKIGPEFSLPNRDVDLVKTLWSKHFH